MNRTYAPWRLDDDPSGRYTPPPPLPADPSVRAQSEDGTPEGWSDPVFEAAPIPLVYETRHAPPPLVLADRDVPVEVPMKKGRTAAYVAIAVGVVSLMTLGVGHFLYTFFSAPTFPV